MSLGDFSNNSNYNNNKKQYQPKVYSQYKMSNAESTVDATALSTSFWNSMLVLSISPKKDTKDGSIAFDHENAATIYLSHTKARLLYNEICIFLENPEQYLNVGVSSGSGLITISNGKEYGVNCPLLIISKVNPETGVIDSSYAYQFRQDYHYSIRNFDKNTSDFDKVYHNNLEIEQLKTLLMSYYEAMTGAMAYSVIDNMKYDISRINTKLDSCAEKLGVEYKGRGNGNSNNRTGGSIFDKSEGRGFSNSTLDDIEGLLG